MCRTALRILVLSLVIAAAFVLAADSHAQGMSCSGPYWDSRSYNSGTYPASGGCWLSGSICYECWNTVSYESAGCEGGISDCAGTLGLVPEVQHSSMSLPSVQYAAVQVCHRQQRIGTVLEEKSLL